MTGMVNPKPSNTTNPDTIGGWKDAFSSLRSRDFRFLWLGSLSVFAGYQMAAVARGYLTYDMTSSPLLLGVVSVGYAFPMLMLSLFGGALADRFRKRRIIQVCQILIAAISIFIAVSITTETITWIHLLFASITNGIVFAFMVPSRTALIPQLVGTETVTNALALNSAARSTMTMLAPAIAGNLYNCSDFSSWYTAQTCYERCMAEVGNDIHGLDGDHDGEACEGLEWG